MADNILKNIRIKLRSDTEAKWTSENPVLLNGELAISSDKFMYKTGNGTSTWSQLPYNSAVSDSSGQNIRSTYLKNITASGQTLTLTKGDNATSTITTQDTRNTAGSTNSNSKLFLIGATNQAVNPQTYSRGTCYIGTDGCLYSNGTKTSVEGHTHNYAGSTSSGGASNSLVYFKNTSTTDVGLDSTDANAIGYVNDISILGQKDGALIKQSYSSAWMAEIFMDYRTGQLASRGKNNGTFQTWRTQIDSGNYSNYTVTKTGGGASGTWGINISGNAATATKLEAPKTINGTNFDGTKNITTTNWGSSRPIKIGQTSKNVNGSNGVTWTLEEIGAFNSQGGVIGGNDTYRMSLYQEGIQIYQGDCTVLIDCWGMIIPSIKIGNPNGNTNDMMSLTEGSIKAPLLTSTILDGNKGKAIINSTAPAGSYSMLAKMNSTNGYFTLGSYQNKFLLNYTAKSLVDAGTNNCTKQLTLLNENGDTFIPGKLVVGNTPNPFYLGTNGYNRALFIQGETDSVMYAENPSDSYAPFFAPTWVGSGSGKVNLGAPAYKWKNIYASTSTIVTSDRRAKNTITSLDAANTEKFVMGLNPVSYKLNEGDSGRTHYGLIAQDIEDLLESLGMSSSDFAGFVKSRNQNENQTLKLDGTIEKSIITDKTDTIYSLRYEEFIAPLIKMIQTQQKEIMLIKMSLEEISKSIQNIH